MKKSNQKKKEQKPIEKHRVCCACRKAKKIVNMGGPPLCKDCYPLAVNWSEAFTRQQHFYMSLAGIVPEEFDTGRKDDVDYMMSLMSEDLAEAKLKIRQTEICMININTMLKNEVDEKEKPVEFHEPVLKCYRCGKTEEEQGKPFGSVYGFCDKCHEEFIPLLRELRLAYIHHFMHPEKNMIYVNDNSKKMPKEK